MKKASIILFVLFFSILSGQSIFAQKANFSVKEYDFGKIQEENGPVTFNFEFTNEGEAPLIISNVAPSCGCTTPTWTKEPVAPKGKGVISTTYNPSGRPGQFYKSIKITTNDKDNPSFDIYIKGEVIPTQQVKN